MGLHLTEAYSTRFHTKNQAQKIDSIAFSGYTTSYGYAVHIGACLEVNDDGHAVDADEGLLINGAAVDSVRVAVMAVSIFKHTMQFDYPYQETPPAMAIGAQPVPMGMFRAETSMPSRAKIRPLVTDETELEFWTFWQHWAPLVGAEPPVEPVGTAATVAARRTRGAKNCMFGIERRRWS
jgi:hypothetical protein